MKAQDFHKWCEVAGAKFAADFTRLIGVNRNTAQEFYAAAERGEDVPIKRPVALAMSAVAQGLRPWDSYERE